MKRSSIRALAIVVALAAPAAAQEWRGSVTPGATVYFPSDRWKHSDTTSWRDQYEFMPNEGDAPPWYLDLLESDGGYQRDDETWLVHVERSSPFAYGERTFLDLDWLGLRIDGEAFRLRTEDLRVFPVGTGDTGFRALPRLGTHFNDDSAPDDRFLVRRYGGGGSLRLRPSDFGVTGSPLTQFTFYGGQELRTGRRQDRYLLDPEEVGTGPETARFRGRTRDLDQEVTTLGGRFVAAPFEIATGVLDLSWQRFHERGPIALVDEIPDPNVEPTAGAAQRALFFVPDTNRMTGSLLISRRIHGATLHGGAFATHLMQTGARPPLQRDAGLRGNDVTTFSAHGAADVPITSWLGFDAYGKAAVRKNGLGRDTTFFADDNRTQLYPFLKNMVDVRSGAELMAEPMRGTRVGLGWRMRDVNRDLDYPQTVAADGIAQRAITPPVSLVGEDSARHDLYVRGHARLLKRTRVAAEGGYFWAPATGSPRELERGLHLEGRLSHGIARPVPLTLSVFGHLLDGQADGWELQSIFPGRSKDKDYESRNIDWGFSIAAVPTRTTTVYLTVTQQLDREKFPHIRSNVPRPNGADFVRFFRDSDLGWDTDARIVAIGGLQQITRRIDLSLAGWLGFVDGRFGSGGATAAAIEGPNRIDLTYGSAEATVGVQIRPELRIGLAYRYDAYRDDARLDEPKRDGHDHALTLSATYDFELPSGP